MGDPNNTVRFSIIHFVTTTKHIHRLENDPLNSEVPQDHTAVVATLNGLCYTSGGTDMLSAILSADRYPALT